MKVQEQIERIKLIHDLIERQDTGTAIQFEKKLYISRRQLYNILEELKLLGAPIKYDSIRKTFYYTAECNIDLSFTIELLTEEEMRDVSGGISPCHYNLYPA